MSTTFRTEYGSLPEGSGPSRIHGANSRDPNGLPNQEGSEGSGDEKDEEIARLKRAYHNAVMENSGKNASTKTNTLKTLGRGIPKIVSLFEPVKILVANADRHQLSQNGELPDVEFEGLDEGEVSQLKRSFARSAEALNELTRLIPNFQKKIDDAEPDDAQEFYNMLQAGAKNARGDDVSKLMGRIAEWLNQQYPDAPPLSTIKRDGRGIHHPITGMLLCPIRYEWDNEGVRTKLREADPEYDYTIDICLRCFYRSFNGSSDNPERGFLQSALLVKTFKHIFTSPSSSHDISILDCDNNVENIPPPTKTRRTETGKAKANTRKAVAANLHMTRVSSRAIAYAAVQLALALSDAPTWCIEHNGLNFHEMYNTIIDYFEDVPDEAKKKQRQQLLAWWSHQIFPEAKTRKSSDVRSNTLRFLNGA